MTRSASQRLHFLSRPFISNDYARQPHVNGLSTASAICAPGGVTRGLNCVFRQFMEMLQTAFRTGPFSFINPLQFLENALTQQHWVKELETEGWDGMGRGKEEKPIGMTTGKEEKPIRMTMEGGPSMTASYPANAAEHRTLGYEKRGS